MVAGVSGAVVGLLGAVAWNQGHAPTTVANVGSYAISTGGSSSRLTFTGFVVAMALGAVLALVIAVTVHAVGTYRDVEGTPVVKRRRPVPRRRRF